MHTFALLPTGGGKSICFQVPGMIMDGICIVVSPLVALMNDQVRALKSKGIKAMALTGGIGQDELVSQLDNARYGDYKFLYLSPERLQQELVQNAIRKMNVNLIAVDEAHCISQWGSDFRPAYQNIHVLRELHPYVPLIALTATATPKVVEDTIDQLNVKDIQIFKSSFKRENLVIRIIRENDKLNRICEILESQPGTSIVYVRSRNQAESISSNLEARGISSTFYHGGLETRIKNDRLDAWKEKQVMVMVATNAFGMGIDHPEVRNVIHIQLPESLESYYQEAGRAGRDSKIAFATLAFNEEDIQIAKKQFVDAAPGFDDIKGLYRNLNNYFQISYGEGVYTTYSFNFNDFCTTYGLNGIKTYNGLNTLDRLGVIQLSKEFGRKSSLQFLVSSEALLRHFDENPKLSIVGKTILRMYGGIFETKNRIDLEQVARKIGIDIDRVIVAMKEMAHLDLAEIELHETDASITFLVPREDERTLNPLKKEIEGVKKKKEASLAAVLDFIQQDDRCRVNDLVAYFGEKSEVECGLCDVCTSKTKTVVSVAQLSEEILKLLQETSLSSRDIARHINETEQSVIHTLRLLLDAGKITLTATNTYAIK